MSANELLEYGWPAIVVALGGYILLVEKRHREERDDWRREHERQLDESNRNIKENTSILSALKTLLESRR